jgi:uncharacterized membrane protein YccF (DUF307 family)
LAAGLLWVIVGVLMAISIIGLPWARSCFVIAKFSFLPFGRDLIRRDELYNRPDISTGALGMLGNLIWILVFGWWLALSHLIAAIPLALSIIGIPFAVQHFKLAAVSFAPVGKTVVKRHIAEAARMQNAQVALQQLRAGPPGRAGLPLPPAIPSDRLAESAPPLPVVPLQLEAARLIVARGGQTLGKFTAQEIKEHLAAGSLRGDDLFWNEHANEWQLLIPDPPEIEVARLT